LTRPDRGAPPAPDLLGRDFTAPGPNVKWCGDLTEIPNDEGPLYLLVTWNQAGGSALSGVDLLLSSLIFRLPSSVAA